MTMKRSRERMYMVSESDLKRFRIFYQIPKTELAGWTMASSVVGYATEVNNNPLTPQGLESLLDSISESGILHGLNKESKDFIKSCINQ